MLQLKKITFWRRLKRLQHSAHEKYLFLANKIADTTIGLALISTYLHKTSDRKRMRSDVHSVYFRHGMRYVMPLAWGWGATAGSLRKKRICTKETHGIVGRFRGTEITEYQLFHRSRLHLMYRVILKKVSFGVFRTILVYKAKKNFTIKSKYKVLSLSKFSYYLVMVKIIKIRHLKGHISPNNHDSRIVFMRK